MPGTLDLLFETTFFLIPPITTMSYKSCLPKPACSVFAIRPSMGRKYLTSPDGASGLQALVRGTELPWVAIGLMIKERNFSSSSKEEERAIISERLN